MIQTPGTLITRSGDWLLNYYSFLKTKSILSNIEEACLDFINCPINKDGFRSIEFEKFNNDKPSIMLLGDSFTWGHSTRNKTSSFSDILLARGYTVYNMGITATDVAQYLAIAKKYIPRLQPDYVVVNFYLGNDISYYKRPIVPYRKLFYVTNAGFLLAFYDGYYFESLKDTYSNAFDNYIIQNDSDAFNFLCSKLVLTTFIWRFYEKISTKYHISPYLTFAVKSESENIQKLRKYEVPYSNLELAEIKNIADNYGAQFVLSSIPILFEYNRKTKVDFPDIFGGLDYVELDVKKEWYNLKDGHFNDLGHKIYADFLEENILKYE